MVFFSYFLKLFFSKLLLLIPKNCSGGFAPLTPHRGLCPLDPCWGSAPDPVGLRQLGAVAPKPLRAPQHRPIKIFTPPPTPPKTGGWTPPWRGGGGVGGPGWNVCHGPGPGSRRPWVWKPIITATPDKE